MKTKTTEIVKVSLPKDIIYAMRALDDPEVVEKKLKTALAILLFREGSISLGKATELAGTSRVRFMDILKEHDIPVYEYGEQNYERDLQAVHEYRDLVEK